MFLPVKPTRDGALRGLRPGYHAIVTNRPSARLPLSMHQAVLWGAIREAFLRIVMHAGPDSAIDGCTWRQPYSKKGLDFLSFTHRIEVEADSASFSMEIRNIPSENPRTGKITALSVIAALRKLAAPLRVGT